MDIDKVILSIKEIANLGIGEIYKEKKHSFVFRVSEKWYHLRYEQNYGAHLKLTMGYIRTDINEVVFVLGALLVGTKEKQKGDDLFEYFENHYLTQLCFNSEKLIKDLQIYITLAPKISLLEKLSEDAFIINIEGESFSIVRSKVVVVTNLSSSSKVEIKSCKINKEMKTLRDADTIDNIFTTLNVLYYLNKNKTKEFYEKDFLEYFQ